MSFGLVVQALVTVAVLWCVTKYATTHTASKVN